MFLTRNMESLITSALLLVLVSPSSPIYLLWEQSAAGRSQKVTQGGGQLGVQKVLSIMDQAWAEVEQICGWEQFAVKSWQQNQSRRGCVAA